VSKRAWLLFAAVGVLWGIPYLLIRVAVREVEPAVVVASRTLVGAALLVPYALARGEFVVVFRRWRPLVAYTVVEMAIPWLLMSRAEQTLPSSLTGLLVATAPLVAALLAWRLDGARLGRQQAGGLALGLLGVVALVGLDLSDVAFVPLAEMAVVVVCYAIGPRILAGPLSGLPVIGVVAASVGMAAVGYAPAGAATWPDSRPSAKVLAALVGLGIFCTAGAFVCFLSLIAEVGPVRALVVTYVNPAVAVLLGVVLLGEAFTVGTAVGFVLVLAGSALAAREPDGAVSAELAAESVAAP
jgi:drug/metabolite transporter (DMT)-like permease